MTTEPIHPGRREGRRAERGFGLVEALVALVVLTVGMLGVAGLSAGVAEQTRRSAWETEQALVAQQLMDSIRRAGYAAATDGADTLAMGGVEWAAAWAVSQASPGLKRVDVDVDGRGEMGDRTYTARLHQPTALPSNGGGGGDEDGDSGPIELPEDLPEDLTQDEVCYWWMDEEYPGQGDTIEMLEVLGYYDLADRVESRPWRETEKEFHDFCSAY